MSVFWALTNGRKKKVSNLLSGILFSCTKQQYFYEVSQSINLLSGSLFSCTKQQDFYEVAHSINSYKVSKHAGGLTKLQFMY